MSIEQRGYIPPNTESFKRKDKDDSENVTDSSLYYPKPFDNTEHTNPTKPEMLEKLSDDDAVSRPNWQETNPKVGYSKEGDDKPAENLGSRPSVKV
ncbi:hypothetical protein HYV70_01990 [Candidatus Uhrbacteria bacterium]|nr:hypothetical protein [Candidatus Uhrbacteria bacterium]